VIAFHNAPSGIASAMRADHSSRSDANMPQNQPFPNPAMPGFDPIPGSVPEPIDFSQLCWEDYTYAAMAPIFASGMSAYAGKMVNPVIWIREGMRKVFDWWCSSGLGCGEPDMIDAASDIAWGIAQGFYPENDTLQIAFDSLMPYMMSKQETCRGRLLTTGFVPSNP
jgi:hypothetical protein